MKINKHVEIGNWNLVLLSGFFLSWIISPSYIWLAALCYSLGFYCQGRADGIRYKK